MIFETALTAAVIFLVLYIGVYLARPGDRKKKRLKKRYAELMRLPPPAAKKALERQVEKLKERYPGKPGSWYIEKAVFDLEKDRYR